ncbi:MAG TPA: citrate/2-methylcitrate synthase [Chloroflexota bacterium]|nr:citrate/2-methylcitrate synthase [Chloroflexota bacterium]
MSSATEQVHVGLEGVLAGESAVTFLDGLADPSVLEYRGYNIHDIAETTSFEEIAYLVLEGKLPNKAELAAFDRELKAAREVHPVIVEAIEKLPKGIHPMAAFRTVVSLLGCLDPQQEDNSKEANRAKAVRMTAQFATIVAAQHRIDEGKPVVAPDLSLGHAANYLYMLNGERGDEASVRTLDTAMNLYAEHEANASTFATRVVVGTNSDLHSAIVAGIGALKGPAHGGAADDAIALIQEIGNVENVKPWVDQAFAERRLIPGFGHRVYKTGDARTPHLRNMCRALAERSTTKDSSWVDIALATEDYVRSMKRLIANVDLYAAAALFYLDFPLNLFTNFVASARIVGWAANAMEQYEKNRIIRPRMKYVGQRERKFVPLEDR